MLRTCGVEKHRTLKIADQNVSNGHLLHIGRPASRYSLDLFSLRPVVTPWLVTTKRTMVILRSDCKTPTKMRRPRQGDATSTPYCNHNIHPRYSFVEVKLNSVLESSRNECTARETAAHTHICSHRQVHPQAVTTTAKVLEQSIISPGRWEKNLQTAPAFISTLTSPSFW
jgi:hypothetical protein